MPIQQLLLVSIPKWNQISGRLTNIGVNNLKRLLDSFPWDFKNQNWEVLSGTFVRSQETAQIAKKSFGIEAEVRKNLHLNVNSRSGGIALSKLLDTEQVPFPIDCSHAVMILANHEAIRGLVHGIKISKGLSGYYSKIAYPAIQIFLSTGEIREIYQAEPQQLELE